ncbi:alpha/beta fold hydrolase [Salidesulfovibrio onnuriiensis]|uniref:alpha/beta fold hydrolase n=1 Tax=Salidesulfovibrio onnuriiensis TaxID=2583823 RepID=UPI00202B48E3|nr:alpha/beta hydrolase [Salidesulfovibrio onnuriiensis]
MRTVPAPDMLRTVPVRRVEVDGARIAYRELGAGQPLLLVMGYAGTMDVWDPVLVDRLSRRYRVILFDNRGMGQSGPWSGSLSMELMARDALAVLDALDARGAHVLGWSMGGMIAQEMALREPDKVGKLVLYGPTPSYAATVRSAVDRMMTCSPEDFAGLLFPGAWVESHPGVFARLPVPERAADPDVVAAQKRAMEQWPGTKDRLSFLCKDVLLVVGDEDWVTPPSLGLRMAANLPGAWMVRFRQGGHWLMYQEPERLADTVRFFLETKEQ